MVALDVAARPRPGPGPRPAPGPAPQPRPARSGVPRPSAVQLAAVLAVQALVVALVWLGSGGRWFVVSTASMGRDAPVGTLLWVRPVDAGSLHVGDFITFHPPGSASTYSHRIVRIDADGGIHTKGTLSAPDAWTLRPSDVVGRVVMRWWAVGWLVRGLPIMLLGAALLTLLRRRLRGDRRTAATVVGVALILCTVLIVLRPLTRAQLVASSGGRSGGTVTYVSTGLLPMRLDAPGSAPVVLRPGDRASITVTRRGADGRFHVAVNPVVEWWVWALVIAFGAVPGAVAWYRRRHSGQPASAGRVVRT